MEGYYNTSKLYFQIVGHKGSKEYTCKIMGLVPFVCVSPARISRSSLILPLRTLRTITRDKRILVLALVRKDALWGVAVEVKGGHIQCAALWVQIKKKEG